MSVSFAEGLTIVGALLLGASAVSGLTRRTVLSTAVLAVAAGILLALTGVAAAVTFHAWYMLGALVFGLLGVAHFRRSWPRRPYPPARPWAGCANSVWQGDKRAPHLVATTSAHVWAAATLTRNDDAAFSCGFQGRLAAQRPLIRCSGKPDAPSHLARYCSSPQPSIDAERRLGEHRDETHDDDRPDGAELGEHGLLR